MKIHPASIGMSLLLSGLLLVSAGCSNKAEDETAASANAAGDTMAQAGANAAENTGDAMKNAGDKMEGTAKNAGDKMAGAANGVSDAGVTAKVKNAINMSTVIDHKTSKINVDTKDNQVILRGTVVTAAEKAEAVKLAKANAGTRKVVDQLTLGKKM